MAVQKEDWAREMNIHHRSFWEAEAVKFRGRAERPALIAAALRRVQDEQLRRVPVTSQKDLGAFLADVERELAEFSQMSARERGANGGRSRKPDALNLIIESLVAKRPRVSLAQLLDSLKQHEGLGVISDIADNEIGYVTKGHSKVIRVSGLKDRLSRARKKAAPKK